MINEIKLNKAELKLKISNHIKKVKKRYKHINLLLWKLPQVQSAVKKITKLVNITKANKIKADAIQAESQMMINKSLPAQELMESLSVSSLHDIHDIETKGSVQKPTFFDMININNKRRDINKIVESNDNTLAQIREEQIDVLKIQIEKLLEEMDKK